jgi:hypothetical protein
MHRQRHLVLGQLLHRRTSTARRHRSIRGHATLESRRDDGDTNFLGEVGIDHRSENDVGVGVSGFVNQTARIVNLGQGQIRTAGDVDQDAGRAVDRDVFQQGRGDSHLGSVDRAFFSPCQSLSP